MSADELREREPRSLRLRADEIQAGDIVFDEAGERHQVRAVRRLRGRVVRVLRDDGFESDFLVHQGVTFIPRERLAS